MNEKELLLLNIGKMYVDYHQKRKLISDLKYTRTIEFKKCEVDYYINDDFDENQTCYNNLKFSSKPNYVCPNCQINYDRHLEIVKLGRQAGGLKYSLNKLIEKL